MKDGISKEEWETRVELAAVYRLTSHYKMDELFQNHIAARVPGEENTILINPYDRLFSQVTASSLVKVTYDGEVIHPKGARINKAAVVIHGAVLKARPDIACTLHLHTPSSIAVGVHPEGLLPLSQRALYFQPMLSYHDYEGLSDDMDEQVRLAQNMGDNWFMLLRHHGTLSGGRTIGQAFIYAFYFESACVNQVAILSCNMDTTTLTQEVIEHTGKQALKYFPQFGIDEWPALLKLADSLDPSYKE